MKGRYRRSHSERGILFFFLFFFLKWTTLKNRKKIVHLYGCAIFTTQNTDIQIIIIAQNPYNVCTNSARIALFSKKCPKVRKQKILCDFVRLLYACNKLIFSHIIKYTCTKVLPHDFCTIFVQGLGYILGILYICVKINYLNDKERPIRLLASL